MSNTTTSSGGVGVFGLVFIVLLTLKLAEVGSVAALSWWWVFAPLFAPLAILVAVFAAMGVGVVIAGIVGVFK